MNRALIITTGIVIITLVLGVLIYLILFGTPKEDGEVFTNLGFEIGKQDTTITPPVDNKPLDTLIDTQSDAALRQLTTRPVAGFAFASASNEQTIRYVERGTGHVYEINLSTGVESILSRTTIPKVSSAIFSPSSNTVALTSYEKYKSNVFVGTIGDEVNLTGVSLQPGAENIAFDSDEDILYTIFTNETTDGYTHNLTTLVQTEVFSMDYKNLDVSWGSHLDSVYITTKPSKDLEGFIYKTTNSILEPVAPSAYGLSAIFSKDGIITTQIQENNYHSQFLGADGGSVVLPIIALKEKCVFDTFTTKYLWCAAPIENTSNSFVEDWYKGTKTNNDYLWLVNTNNQTAQLLANPENLTGRTIDVQHMQINPDGGELSFINKKDQTLWLYDF